MFYDSDGEEHLDAEETYLRDQFGSDGFSVELCQLGGGNYGDGFPDPMGSLMGPEEGAETLETAQIMHAALSHLPLRHAEVLKYRYGIGGVRPQSQAGVSRLLGLTERQVRRIERDAETKLLSALDKVPGGAELKLEMFEEKLRHMQDPAKIYQFAEDVA